MDEHDVVAERFEAHRARLRAVAYQTLGSASEADDAVQEAWLRLSRTDPGSIENLGGWLTTVVARVCLNMLQSRREQPVGMHLPEPVVTDADGIDPEQEALLADSIGPALLVILHTLAPAERLAFVLHDMFAVPFDDIAAILGRYARQAATAERYTSVSEVLPAGRGMAGGQRTLDPRGSAMVWPAAVRRRWAVPGLAQSAEAPAPAAPRGSGRVRVPPPLISRRLPSGRGATEQPNVTGDGDAPLTPRFWATLVATGAAAGLFGDLMMYPVHCPAPRVRLSQRHVRGSRRARGRAAPADRAAHRRGDWRGRVVPAAPVHQGGEVRT